MLLLWRSPVCSCLIVPALYCQLVDTFCSISREWLASQILLEVLVYWVKSAEAQVCDAAIGTVVTHRYAAHTSYLIAPARDMVA